MCFIAVQIPECFLGLALQGLVNPIWDSHEPFRVCTHFAHTWAVTGRPNEISGINRETSFSTFPSE